MMGKLEKIKKICSKADTCRSCPFNDDDCIFEAMPENWDIKKIKEIIENELPKTKDPET